MNAQIQPRQLSAMQRQIDAQSPPEPQDGPDLDDVMEAIKDGGVSEEVIEAAVYAVMHNDFHWLERVYDRQVRPLLEKAA